MPAATSLIELILKKWGDDIAGAAKELEEKVGFPESVANRIATGELPMDAESVAKRAQDQGYDLSSRWYHGTNDDFSEFDPERVGSAYGVDDQGFYFTSSENEAMKWAENAPNASSPRVMETLLSTDNPWLIDAPDGRSPVEYFESGEGVFNRGQNAAVDYGIDSGYDGMVIRGGDEDMAIAFDPSRIRSPTPRSIPSTRAVTSWAGLALPVAGGLLAAGQSEDADAGFITKGGKTLLEAWHGSPHKFDRFSMDQIGTGEGAQAYGHGLYFADSEDVARTYKEMGLNHKLTQEVADKQAAIRELQKRIEVGEIALKGERKDYFPEVEAKLGEYKEQLKALNAELENAHGGHLYRAEIDVTPESLLDWDKPLSEQSRAVRSAVQDIAENGDHRFTDKQISLLNDALQSFEAGNTRGQSIIGILGDDYSVDPRSVDSAYSAAARSFKEYDYPYETALEDIKGAYPDAKPEELEWALKKEYGIGGRAGASSALSDRGIKGIKYLDGDSRL